MSRSCLKMQLRASACAVALALGFVSWHAARAEDKPAVSEFNGKLDYTGGNLDGYSANVLNGSVTAPLGHSFGAQFDASGGNISGTLVKGYGGHLFWRDPDMGMVGVVGARTGFGTYWGNRLGVEGEAYLGPVTLAVVGGWQNGELKHTGWANADVRYYPLDNLMLEAGAGVYNVQHTGHVGFEWRPAFLDAVPGLALFGDAGFGERNYEHALAGVRIYFGGGDKSLVRRHREDDPLSLLMGGITQSVGPSGATSVNGNGNGVDGGGGSGAGGGGPGHGG